MSAVEEKPFALVPVKTELELGEKAIVMSKAEATTEVTVGMFYY